MRDKVTVDKVTVDKVDTETRRVRDISVVE